MIARASYGYTASIVIVSFNTRELLGRCLDALLEECARLGPGLSAEILVVDNASRDGSAQMVEENYAHSSVPVRLFASQINLGFGAANNLAITEAEGRFIILLNSDAFFHPGALEAAIRLIEAHPRAGASGAQLLNEDGSWQPSARSFHSIYRDALVLSGLPDRFPHSRLFGSPDRSWADPQEPAQVDWVTGAFMILRREALATVGLFDPLLRRGRSLQTHSAGRLRTLVLATDCCHASWRRIEQDRQESLLLRDRRAGGRVAHALATDLLPQASRCTSLACALARRGLLSAARTAQPHQPA